MDRGYLLGRFLVGRSNGFAIGARRNGHPPVLASSNPLSTLHRRFACARLSQPCLPESCPGVPQRSPPSLLTTAACGGLRPEPDCRPRRALLHLSYSSAPPYSCGAFVTHDPLRTSSPSFHSISSSARRRNDSGIVKPSAFAVLRLMTSSNLVGCSTGRSAGLAPFRILSTWAAAWR